LEAQSTAVNALIFCQFFFHRLLPLNISAHRRPRQLHCSRIPSPFIPLT